MTRDEPVASVIQEALEGYASGRFETQADVMRFLQDSPLYPKDTYGFVRHQRVIELLGRSVYAGYVEAPKWGVPLRLGHHEALISFETFQRIQDRRNGVIRAPRQKNVNEDFPLRGFVVCADCGSPLTGGWSKGAHSLHPYYLCQKRGCPSYGKSIRRADIEGAFEAMLRDVQPSATLFKVATTMFEDLWNRRLTMARAQAGALRAQAVKIEKQIAQFLDRILETSVPSVVAAYEDRVRKLEEEKLLINERMEVINLVEPLNIFDDIAIEARRTKKTESDASIADTIAHQLTRVIEEKWDEDPTFFEKFSKMVRDTIADFHKGRISDLAYLSKIREFREKAQHRQDETDPTPPNYEMTVTLKLFGDR